MKASTQDWLVLYPSENQREFVTFLSSDEKLELYPPKDSGGRHDLAPRWVGRLRDVAQMTGVLTDGFDGYRVLIRGTGPQIWPKIVVQEPEPSPPDDERSSRGATMTGDLRLARETVGFLEEDVQISSSLAESLAGLFRDPIKSAVQPIHWTLACVPFDADPQEFARDVAGRLGLFWLDQAKTLDQFFDLPVIMPVAWHEFSDPQLGPPLTAATLPDRLERYLTKQSSSTRYKSDLPNSDALRIALRRPGKFVFIAYEEKSQDVWQRIAAGETAYDDRAQLMVRLNRGSEPLAPQHMVMVCSDYHHQLKIESLCKKT